MYLGSHWNGQCQGYTACTHESSQAARSTLPILIQCEMKFWASEMKPKNHMAFYRQICEFQVVYGVDKNALLVAEEQPGQSWRALSRASTGICLAIGKIQCVFLFLWMNFPVSLSRFSSGLKLGPDSHLCFF